MSQAALEEKVLKKLEGGNRMSIPELCRAVKEKDEYNMLRVIAELEDSGDAMLNGFDRIYREDGGAIYLAKYSKKS